MVVAWEMHRTGDCGRGGAAVETEGGVRGVFKVHQSTGRLEEVKRTSATLDLYGDSQPDNGRSPSSEDIGPRSEPHRHPG
jgi:hypothetical protein